VEVNLRGVDLSRRRIINALPYILAGAFIYPVGKFLFFSDQPDRHVTLPLREIKEGITPMKEQQLFLSKRGEQITVFDAHCTHMGCLIIYNPQKHIFNCPCHQSRFDHNGNVLRGPAKRSLDRIDFKIKNKTLYI
jgi:cytochrome b6-f complex iron-sulfur subunit